MLEAQGHLQVLRRRAGTDRRGPHGPRRHGARAARRERSGQVNAREDHRRGAARATAATLRLDGEEVSFATTADAAAQRRRRRLAGAQPVRGPRPAVATCSRSASRCAGRSWTARRWSARPAGARRPRPRRLPLRQQVGELSLAQRQLVEVAKALVTEPRVLMLDEPTSALEAASTEMLMGVVRVLRERDVAVVFVSHILQEVMALSDEVTVLRDGSRRDRGRAARAALDADDRRGDARREGGQGARSGGPRTRGDGAGRARARRRRRRRPPTRAPPSAAAALKDVSVKGGSRAWTSRRGPARSSASPASPAPGTRRCSSWSPVSAASAAASDRCPAVASSRARCAARSPPASRW